MPIEILARYTTKRKIENEKDVLYLLKDVRDEIGCFGKIPDLKMSLKEIFEIVKEGQYTTKRSPYYIIDLSEARRKINQYRDMKSISIDKLIENKGQLIVS